MDRPVKKWFCLLNDQESGPFTSEQIKKLVRSGNLKSEDLIRPEGHQKWRKASTVKGLFDSPIETRHETKKKADSLKASNAADRKAGWSMLTVGFVGAGSLILLVAVVWVASAFIRTGGNIEALTSSSKDSIDALLYCFEPSPENSSRFTFQNVHPGEVNWTVEFEYCDPKGKIAIKQPRSDRPIEISLVAATEAIPVWQAIPPRTQVRLKGMLTPDVLIEIYPPGGVVSDEFEYRTKALAEGKGVLVDLTMLRRAVLLVTEARPVSPVPLEGNAAAEAFVKHLEQNGAVISRDDAGRTVSVSHTPILASRVATDALQWRWKQSNPQLTDASFERLADLPELWYVLVASQGLTGKSLEVAARMPKLKSLALMNTQITDDDLAHLIAAPSLTSLTLSLNEGISDAGLAHIKQMKSLESLDLNGTKVTPAGIAALKEALPKLNVSAIAEKDDAEKRKSVETARVGNKNSMFIVRHGAEHLKPLSLFRAFSGDPIVPVFLNQDQFAYLEKYESDGPKVWDLAKQRPFRLDARFPAGNLQAGHPNKMLAGGVQRPRDKKNVVELGGNAFLWDFEASKEVWQSEKIEPPLYPNQVRFSPDGLRLAVECRGRVKKGSKEARGELRILHTGNGEVAATKAWESGFVQDFAFSPDGENIAVILSRDEDSIEESVVLYNSHDGSEIWSINDLPARELEFVPNGQAIVVRTIDGGQFIEKADGSLVGDTHLMLLSVETGLVGDEVLVEGTAIDFSINYDGQILAVMTLRRERQQIDIFSLVERSAQETHKHLGRLVSTEKGSYSFFGKMRVQFGHTTNRLAIQTTFPRNVEFWEFVQP